jgi:hypothetical protein
MDGFGPVGPEALAGQERKKGAAYRRRPPGMDAGYADIALSGRGRTPAGRDLIVIRA